MPSTTTVRRNPPIHVPALLTARLKLNPKAGQNFIRGLCVTSGDRTGSAGPKSPGATPNGAPGCVLSADPVVNSSALMWS